MRQTNTTGRKEHIGKVVKQMHAYEHHRVKNGGHLSIRTAPDGRKYVWNPTKGFRRWVPDKVTT